MTYTTRRQTPAAAAPPSTQGPAVASPASATEDATAAVEESEEHAPAAGRARLAAWFGTPGSYDVAACLAYVAFAFWLTAGLWPNPNTRAIGANPEDQTLIEWFLARGVLVWRGDFSLVTDRLNAPQGVNLMANASHLLHGVIMAPVTVLFGAAVSFALLVALNLAATAAGWYLLLVRGLGLRRVPALIGAAVTGFAPGMISQSNSHLHMTAQWLVPPILWFVIRLTRGTTTRVTVTSGAALGALLAAQLLLGEEVLFLTVLAAVLFFGTYAIARPAWTVGVAPRVLAGAGVAVLTAVPLVAYPLWVQFFGKLHTSNAPFAPEVFYSDLASFTPFSPLSLAGSPGAGWLATGPTEYNTYLGLPLLLLVLACLLWGVFGARRNVAVIAACAVAGGIMAYLSLGPYVTLNGVRTGWPSLYNQIADLPVINAALPTRYALALIPIIGVLLAYTLDAAAELGGLFQPAAIVVVVAALVPAMPAPLATTNRTPVPEFISSGDWRQCAPDGGVIVPVPLPTPKHPDAMRWPAAANVAFGIPEGFFIAPYGAGGAASIGVYPQPTSLLLADVAATGNVPAIGADQRNQAQADLAYWHANCVALAHGPNETALRTALTQLLGPGTTIRDTWTWKVA